jgi:nucleotide-binding universal stress UspA family protein
MLSGRHRDAMELAVRVERSISVSVPVTFPASAGTAAADGALVVVGYDGSEESRMALAVAVQRAGPHGTVVPVHVVASASDWLGAPYYDRDVEAAHQTAQALLGEIDDLDTGSIAVEPEVIEGEPAEALLRIARSRGAHEIVVGSRGLGRFRTMLGSVSRSLLQRADRPVVIVPKGAVDGDH